MKENEDEAMLEKNKRWRIFKGSKEMWQAFIWNFRSNMAIKGPGHAMIETSKEILLQLENTQSQPDKEKQTVI